MTSLKFGTSGLRGLAVDLAGEPAATYSSAFLRHLAQLGEYGEGRPVVIGMDLRKTSPEIAGWCAAAIEATGGKVLNLGSLPTPALALWCMTHGTPGIMITGSHIPDDRNGLKFYRASGEITKDDEQGIVRLHADCSDAVFTGPSAVPDADDRAVTAFVERYAAPYKRALKGLNVGLYQHSTVGRDVFRTILESAGANILPFGRADHFVPVDTEALRPEDVRSLKVWASENALDAIVSADGDADRPLVANENGDFVLGDTVGALTAQHVGADCIVTPVTSNNALELQLPGISITRTRVGSPYVIEGMQAEANRDTVVVGFEANGGVLLGSDVSVKGNTIKALPTRDSVLPILSVLATISSTKKPLSAIVEKLALNAKHSDRVTDFSRETSEAFIAALADRDGPLKSALRTFATNPEIDTTDGLKLISGRKSLHFRPSGNAPELRVYCEADRQSTAISTVDEWMDIARKFASGDASD